MQSGVLGKDVMQLPNITIPPEMVMNEYAIRLSDATATNIRLGLMVQILVEQRENAMRNWEMVAAELQQLRMKYEPETAGTVTPLEGRR